MKHGKHAKHGVNQERELSSYSSKSKARAKRDDDVILSKTPKGKKVFDFITKLLFALTMLFTVFVIIVATFENAPTKILFLVIIALGIIVGLQMALLSGKIRRKRFKRKRIISMGLSIVMLVISVFGWSYLGVYGNILDLGFSGLNEDKVSKIVEEPFMMYLTGVDTRGDSEIKDKALSDVNMLIAVNPEQRRVLMISVPRDYYVPLDGITGREDKLTHAGTYGTECSMNTLESYFDVNFNYYVKVNFKSVYDIVNAVGGITLESEYSFTSIHSYTGKTYRFTKGTNTLNGDQALAFARERKSFANGDRQRGVHQQLVIKAVADKIASPSIILNPSKLNSIVEAISDNVKTTVSGEEIENLVNNEVNNYSKKWEFTSMSVDGTGASRYCYTYPKQSLSVIIPDAETVEEAKTAINAVLNGTEIPSDEDTVSSQ